MCLLVVFICLFFGVCALSEIITIRWVIQRLGEDRESASVGGSRHEMPPFKHSLCCYPSIRLFRLLTCDMFYCLFNECLNQAMRKASNLDGYNNHLFLLLWRGLSMILHYERKSVVQAFKFLGAVPRASR